MKSVEKCIKSEIKDHASSVTICFESVVSKGHSKEIYNVFSKIVQYLKQNLQDTMLTLLKISNIAQHGHKSLDYFATIGQVTSYAFDSKLGETIDITPNKFVQPSSTGLSKLPSEVHYYVKLRDRRYALMIFKDRETKIIIVSRDSLCKYFKKIIQTRCGRNS